MSPRCVHSARSRPGFTLMETVLAIVLGTMVLVGCMGVFLALQRMENTFSARFARTSELDMMHTIMRRSMLNLQMEETETTVVTRADDDNLNEVEDEPEPRYRIILETDPTVAADSTGWIPQRLEIVNATPPVPAGLATQAAGWYTAEDQSETLDFSAMDGSQGIVRGVFELRPAGQRERIMQRLGLISPTDPIIADLDLDQDQITLVDAPPNWTLWWRPILTYEGEQLLYGFGPYPDTIGTADEIRARLAGAVPIMRGVERCVWELFKGDEFIDTHYGLSMSDLPAYAQFEVILTNSQYASWMFEVDWVLGDDPSTDGSGSEALASGDGDDQSGGAGPQDGGTGDGRPTRPGGQTDPNATRQIDFSGDS